MELGIVDPGIVDREMVDPGVIDSGNVDLEVVGHGVDLAVVNPDVVCLRIVDPE